MKVDYEYECTQCGAIFEIELEMGTAPATVACENCGEQAVRVYDDPSIKYGIW